MTSYQEIIKYLQEKYDYTPKAYAIAHAKEVYGIPIKPSPNRKGKQRIWKCPKRRLAQIEDAFKHFDMI